MGAAAKSGCRRACRRGRRASFGVVVRGWRWCGGEQRCSAWGRGEVARGAATAARAGGVQAAAWKLFGHERRREPEARARDIYDMWARDFS